MIRNVIDRIKQLESIIVIQKGLNTNLGKSYQLLTAYEQGEYNCTLDPMIQILNSIQLNDPPPRNYISYNQQKYEQQSVHSKQQTAPAMAQPEKSKLVLKFKSSQVKPIFPEIILNQRLPVSLFESQIVQLMNKNRILILSAQTGSGKSTQIPKLIKKYLNQQCLVSQPRRLCCVALAQRLSAETSTQCGYAIRFDSQYAKETPIVFATEGLFLQLEEQLNNPFVILDEIHERSIQLDFILLWLKFSQKRAVIMSATLDVDKFQNYFGDQCGSIQIPGKQYNVAVKYRDTDQDDRYLGAAQLVFNLLVSQFLLLNPHQVNSYHQFQAKNQLPVFENICFDSEYPSCLVFLPGQEEISDCLTQVQEWYSIFINQFLNKFEVSPAVTEFRLLPLFAQLPTNQQNYIFECKPRIIFTNIAETSLTIDGISVVIDTGYYKELKYIEQQHSTILQTKNISIQQQLQRIGRCGRQCDGWYYGAFSQQQQRQFVSQTAPEIKRCELAETVLRQIQLFNIQHIQNLFDKQLIDMPSKSQVTGAIATLQKLGAIKILQQIGQLSITNVGKQLLKLPIDIRLGKVLLNSGFQLQYISELAAFISMGLNISTIKSYSTQSDFQCIWRLFQDVRKQRQVFSSHQQQMLLFAKSQLTNIVNKFEKQENYDVELNIQDVEKAFLSGFPENIADYSYQDKCYYKIQDDLKLFIHPTSCLFKQTPKRVIFSSLVETSRLYMHIVHKLDK